MITYIALSVLFVLTAYAFFLVKKLRQKYEMLNGKASYLDVRYAEVMNILGVLIAKLEVLARDEERRLH